MKSIVAAGVLLTAIPAWSGYKFRKDVEPGTLQEELKAAGFKVSHITCINQDCEIIWSGAETKNPSALIAAHVNPRTARATRTKRMRELAEKWKADTITSAEKDELLKTLILQYVGI